MICICDKDVSLGWMKVISDDWPVLGNNQNNAALTNSTE